MEAPGFMLLLYIMFNLPKQVGLAELPGANWLMASLFVSLHDLKVELCLMPLTPDVDCALFVSRHRCSTVPQSQHVSYPHPRLGHGILLPDNQCHLHRRLARWLWPNDNQGVGRKGSLH